MQRAPARVVATLSIFGFLATTSVAHAEDLDACISATEQGQVLRRDEHLRDAREKFTVCAREECPAAVRAQCTTWLDEANAAQPMVILAAHDSRGNDLVDVRVSVDGKLIVSSLDGHALAVDPGVHTFRFEAAGRRPVEQRIVVRESEKSRPVVATLELILAPPPAPSVHRGAPASAYIFGGVGIVALGSWGYFGGRGLSDHFACHSCSTAVAQKANTELLVGDISAAVGVVALGVATWLFLSHGSSEPARGDVATAP